jgi:signal transduction histidine kinase/Tfp pilus assembly protein PilF
MEINICSLMGLISVFELEQKGKFVEAYDEIQKLAGNEAKIGLMFKIHMQITEGRYQGIEKKLEVGWKRHKKQDGDLYKLALLTNCLHFSLTTSKLREIRNLIYLGREFRKKFKSSKDHLTNLWLGRFLLYLGRIEYEAGKFDTSLSFLTESIPHFEFINAKFDYANTIQNFGSIYSKRGLLDDALAYFNQGIVINQEINNRYLEAKLLNNIGISYAKQGQLGKALKFFSDALSIRSEIGNNYEKAFVLNNIGLIQDKLGKYTLAIDSFDKAEGVAITVGNESQTALISMNRGNVYQKTGKLTKALNIYQQSLATNLDLGNQYNVGLCLLNLGNVHYRMGDLDLALDYYDQSLDKWRDVSDLYHMGLSFYNIGLVYYRRGSYDNAIESFTDALNINLKSENSQQNAKIISFIGRIQLINGNMSEAQINFERALEEWSLLDNRDQMSRIYREIGSLYKTQGNYIRAKKYFQDSLAIREELGNSLEISINLFDLFNIAIDLSLFEEAEHLQSRLEAIGLKIQHREVTLRTQLSKAIMLQHSERIYSIGEAYKIYNEIINSDVVDINYQKSAMIYLCEYFLTEYRAFGNERISQDISILIEKLFNLANSQNNYILLVDALLLHSEKSFIEMDLSTALFNLELARQMSETKNLQQHIVKISAKQLEINNILDQGKIEIAQGSKGSKEYLDYIREKEQKRNQFEMYVHDINNLLTINVTSAQLILELDDAPDPVKAYAKLVVQSGENLRDMTHRMLETRQIENKSFEIKLQSLSPLPIVDQRVELYRSRAEIYSIEFDTLHDSEESSITADYSIFIRVLDNLIGNAVKFSPDGTTIRISSSVLDNKWIFNISNEGKPIPLGFQKRLFLKYEKMHQSTHRVERGFGLGLAFCKKSVEMMKGSISVVSPLPGEHHGTQFVVELPLSDPS